MIYMLLDEKKDRAYIKIGSTKSLDRFIQYTTHNADFNILGTIQTYKKTKFRLEKQIRQELYSKGYKRHINKYTDITTEWFAIEYDDIFYKDIIQNGLKVFKNCKTRKVIKWVKA